MRFFWYGVFGAVLFAAAVSYAQADVGDCYQSHAPGAVPGCFPSSQAVCDAFAAYALALYGGNYACGGTEGETSPTWSGSQWLNGSHGYYLTSQWSQHESKTGVVARLCVDPQVYDYDAQACVDPPQQCTPPAVYDPALGFCVTPPSCEIGSTWNGPLQSTGDIVQSTCVSGCSYSLDYFEFATQNAGYGHYVSDGSACSSGEPDQGDPNDPIEPTDPIAPTDPEAPVPDDGNQTDEQATDENQEIMSGQLHGIQQQLGNVEQGVGGLITQGNQQTGVLEQIRDSLQSGTGTGASGTGDGDGDGTDDSWGGDCGTPPVCNGPAIECAIAAQALATRCNLEDETVDITEADVMAQTGQTETLEGYFDDTDPANIIDVDGIFVAPSETTGSCPPDYSVNTSLGSMVFTWGYVCDLGDSVRPVMLLLGWIVSGFMFYNALLRRW